MAKQQAAAAQTAAESSGKSRKTLFVLVGVGLLALLVSLGGVGFFLLGGDRDESTEAPAESVAPVRAMALYQTLEPPFVVNYSHAGRQRYMQVSVALLGRDQGGMASLNRHLPLIRNQLVMLFSSEEFEVLLTPEGKDELRQRATLAVQALLEKEVGNPVIESVLFTNLVLQ
ncbi:flagellar basal body-associated protein FliL [Pseudomonas sp. WN033]|nr:flagellar basal body-associated protein FliL [Pseudomonas sp. WN033]